MDNRKMEISARAVNAAIEIAELPAYLAMAASTGDTYGAEKARDSLRRALAALSDASDPNTLDPHEGASEMTQPDHIITHGGRVFDLTALETPPRLLPDAVCEALEKWPHGCQSLMDDGWIDSHPSRYRVCVQRAKPAPVEVRVPCYRGENGLSPAQFGTCIKRADGTIDWSTWEPL